VVAQDFPGWRYIAALSQQDSKMMLFDARTQKWEELSADYFRLSQLVSRRQVPITFKSGIEEGGLPSQVVRIHISDRKLETIVDLKNLTAYPSEHS